MGGAAVTLLREASRESLLARRHAILDRLRHWGLWCLILATNAVVCWSAEYPAPQSACCTAWAIGPKTRSVHLLRCHSVDVDGEFAQLDASGYRPCVWPTSKPTVDRPANHRRWYQTEWINSQRCFRWKLWVGPWALGGNLRSQGESASPSSSPRSMLLAHVDRTLAPTPTGRPSAVFDPSDPCLAGSSVVYSHTEG